MRSDLLALEDLTPLFASFAMLKQTKDHPNEPTNLRAQRRREQRRLFWAVIAFLVVGGGASIALAYGPPALALGLVCLLTGAGVLGLLWLILLLIERLAD